jgi:2-haloacid dehalogenase
MSSRNNIVVAFDLYGTLLSTDSIAKQLAEHFGNEKATSIATVWRKYQLEYTWRLNSMGTVPFNYILSSFASNNIKTNSKVSPQ